MISLFGFKKKKEQIQKTYKTKEETVEDIKKEYRENQEEVYEEFEEELRKIRKNYEEKIDESRNHEKEMSLKEIIIQAEQKSHPLEYTTDRGSKHFKVVTFFSFETIAESICHYC